MPLRVVECLAWEVMQMNPAAVAINDQLMLI